ncbi:MAG: glycosyltransferase family 2 protein [Crocinitomicaceae bacterium]|nr:glycosyltransferase family 2 protein [Crocinitomicaceae bacterium]
MISICIPIYNFNVVPLVKELLRQIEGRQCELLLIDDASTTFVIENSELHNITNLIVLDQNIGRAQIRNLFLKHAKYEYLLFLDCDSLVENNDFIENYINIIQQGQAKVICGGREYAKNAPDLERRLRWKYGVESESKPTIQRVRLPYRSFMTNNFIVRKDVLEQTRFDESLTLYGHEDTLFGFELKKKSVPIEHIDNPIRNGYLETNEEYLLKTEESIINLVQIVRSISNPMEFCAEVRLLNYYQSVKKKKNIWSLKVLFFISRKRLLNKLLSGKATIKEFNFYKLMLLIKSLEGN